MEVYKAGELSSFFPASVAQGMLTAMGFVIIAKQSHVMLGTTPEPGSLFSTIAQIPDSFLNPTPEIDFIGLTGLAILALWPLLKQTPLGKIPAPVMVLITGIGLGQFFGLQHEHIHFSSPDVHEHIIAAKFLVDIPDNFGDYFYLPDFSKSLTFEFWGAVISICLVASLESLLSATAAEKLDPYKRLTDLDSDTGPLCQNRGGPYAPIFLFLFYKVFVGSDWSSSKRLGTTKLRGIWTKEYYCARVGQLTEEIKKSIWNITLNQNKIMDLMLNRCLFGL